MNSIHPGTEHLLCEGQAAADRKGKRRDGNQLSPETVWSWAGSQWRQFCPPRGHSAVPGSEMLLNTVQCSGQAPAHLSFWPQMSLVVRWQNSDREEGKKSSCRKNFGISSWSQPCPACNRGSEEKRESYGFNRGGLGRSDIMLELGSIIFLNQWAGRAWRHFTERNGSTRTIFLILSGGCAHRPAS